MSRKTRRQRCARAAKLRQALADERRGATLLATARPFVRAHWREAMPRVAWRVGHHAGVLFRMREETT